MGSLYIGGAQCKCGLFKMYEDWKSFDSNKQQLLTLASKFELAIDRNSIDDDNEVQAFIILNKKANYECFYSGGAFAYDMSVEVSETFEQRAQAFIKELNETESFSDFHQLNWSETQVLYFANS